MLIGDSGVGKSSLLVRFADNTFQSHHVITAGVDFRVKTVESKGGDPMKLKVWDSAGQQRYQFITQQHYHSVMGIILVYDVTNEESFQNIQYWVSQMKAYGAANAVCMLLGNKADSHQRVVNTETGYALAEEYGMHFMETSAKDGHNVEEAFPVIADAARLQLQRRPSMTLHAVRSALQSRASMFTSSSSAFSSAAESLRASALATQLTNVPTDPHKRLMSAQMSVPRVLESSFAKLARNMMNKYKHFLDVIRIGKLLLNGLLITWESSNGREQDLCCFFNAIMPPMRTLVDSDVTDATLAEMIAFAFKAISTDFILKDMHDKVKQLLSMEQTDMLNVSMENDKEGLTVDYFLNVSHHCESMYLGIRWTWNGNILEITPDCERIVRGTVSSIHTEVDCNDLINKSPGYRPTYKLVFGSPTSSTVAASSTLPPCSMTAAASLVSTMSMNEEIEGVMTTLNPQHLASLGLTSDSNGDEQLVANFWHAPRHLNRDEALSRRVLTLSSIDESQLLGNFWKSKTSTRASSSLEAADRLADIDSQGSQAEEAEMEEEDGVEHPLDMAVPDQPVGFFARADRCEHCGKKKGFVFGRKGFGWREQNHRCTQQFQQ